MLLDGRGDVDLARLHDGGQRRDVLDAVGAGFADDAQHLVHLVVGHAAEDGGVAHAQEAAGGGGDGGGKAARASLSSRLRLSSLLMMAMISFIGTPSGVHPADWVEEESVNRKA